MLFCRITEDSLFFKCSSIPENKHHEVTINFFNKINPEKYVSKNSGRCYEFIITKADAHASYWSKLTSDKTKPHWLKVDFNKWKDEDELDSGDENPGSGGQFGGMGGDGGMGNFNDLMSSMGGMGGMGGGPGDGKPSFDLDDEADEDSDDEALPDLEDSKK